MKQTNNVEVRRRWEEFRQVGRGRLYAALRADGFISVSGYTHERMGSPDGYLLLFERGDHPGLRRGSATPPFEGGEIKAIGLKAARKGVDKNAYHAAGKAGSNKNRTIAAGALVREFGIGVERTVVFRNCEIDRDGVLVLELGER